MAIESSQASESMNASNYLNASLTPDTMANNRKTFEFNLIVLGNVSVGKTCILSRFTDNKFIKTYKSSVGVEFKLKSIVLDGSTRADLKIWDTVGQERFQSITRQYYKNSNGIILVYDITDRKSFETLSFWINEVKTYSINSNLSFMLVGNKTDLDTKRVVSTEEGEQFAKKHQLLFKEVSALTGHNISLIFEVISRDLVKKRMEEQYKNEVNNKNVPGDNVVIQKQAKMIEEIKGKSEGKKSGGCC